MEPAGWMVAAAVAHAQCAVGGGGRLSGLASAGRVHARHGADAQRWMLRQRRGRPRLRPACEAHGAATRDQRPRLPARGAHAGRRAGAGRLRPGADDQPGHHRLVVRGAGRDAWPTPSPSAWCPCRRRCLAWPSASAFRWPSRPCAGARPGPCSTVAPSACRPWGTACHRWPGCCCWATCSGCWPTTPSTRWSTAMTTSGSA